MSATMLSGARVVGVQAAAIRPAGFTAKRGGRAEASRASPEPARAGGSRFGAIAWIAAAMSVALLSACAPKPRGAIIPYDYASWGKTTEVRLDYPIPGHEDRFRVIYMNARGFTAVSDAAGRLEFPEGTIIAKEVFANSSPGPTDKPAMITAMVKAPSDPDARGGWLWVAKDPSTGAENVGAGDFCVRCHANANEKHPYGDKNPAGLFSDYVFFVPASMRPAQQGQPAVGQAPDGGPAAGSSADSAASSAEAPVPGDSAGGSTAAPGTDSGTASPQTSDGGSAPTKAPAAQDGP